MKKLYIFFIIVLVYHSSFAQSIKEIDLTTIFLEALTTKDSILIYDGYEIIDTVNWVDGIGNHLKTKYPNLVKLDTAGRVIIEPEIRITNSKLPDMAIDSLSFSKRLNFESCNIDGNLIFWQCYIKSFIIFMDKKPFNMLEFGVCNIDEFVAKDLILYSFHTYKLTIKNPTFIMSSIDIVFISSSDFHSSNYQYENKFELYIFKQKPVINSNFTLIQNNWKEIEIEYSNFYSDSLPDDEVVTPFYVTCEKLSINNSNFYSNFDLSRSLISQKLIIDECVFNSYICLTGSLPEQIISDWELFEGEKLAVIETDMMGNLYFMENKVKSYTYLAKNNNNLSNKKKFNSLISSYQLLNNAFKNRADTKSTNDCYYEMKNVQLRKLKYDYLKNPTFESYFSWKLGQLLKTYIRYGTSPAKAVVISLYVIICFAIFYFLFPSDWDIFYRVSFFERLKKLIHYFKSEDSISIVKPFTNTEKHNEILEFKEYMTKNKSKIPYFIYFFTKPFYQISAYIIKISDKVLAKTDLVKGKYSDLPKKNRFRVNLIIGIIFSVFLIVTLIIRFLNAITLSINTFTTLGFGNIPTKGFSRYVAIIQGFIGWFLLSLFSVALINQVLS